MSINIIFLISQLSSCFFLLFLCASSEQVNLHITIIHLLTLNSKFPFSK